MNGNIFIPWITLFFILTFFLLPDHLVGAVDPYYQACRFTTTTCADNQTISFPFYLLHQHNHYCGYPGFDLSCSEKGHPILNNLSISDPYIVRQISYENRSLIVSNAAISHDSTPNCIPRIQNLSFPNERFELPKQNKVYLLYDCQHPPTDPKYQIGCSSENATNWVVGVPENERDQLGNLSSKCGQDGKVVVAPVKDYNSSRDESVGIREVLSRGFELTWKADDCSRCQKSGGVCGFNTTSYLFQCYCKDRPYRVRCRGKGSNKIVIATIATTVAGIGALTVIVICCLRKLKYNKSIFFRKKHNQRDENVETSPRNYGSVQVRRYSYLDVKKMTNSFKEKLGQGGYCSVFKGNLHDGSLVAVKVLFGSKLHDGELFMNEVATVSRTSHVNIVALLGFCIEDGRKALIYEFMPNGSLEKYIFNNNNLLGWETLFQISLGIARGLEYLHRGCNIRILHFDIKPHNILLDENFSPKICDFGLARLCNIKERITSTFEARGTMGYIAPELFYNKLGGVSHKSDVYGYGMMVLEIVGGRKNLDSVVDHSNEIYFPAWIYERLELDEDLGLKRIITNEEDDEKVRKMVKTGLWCIQTDPSNRPTMSKVIEMLEGSHDSLKFPPKPFQPSLFRLLTDSSSPVTTSNCASNEYCNGSF